MKTLSILMLFVLAMLIAPIPGVRAEEPPVSFIKDVAPILVQKCLACHGPEKTKGRFRLDTFEQLMKAGASQSPSIAPGKPAASEFFRLITAKDEDERMPQKDEPLSPQQIALIERWIAQGAHFDGPDPKSLLAVSVAAATAYPQAPRAYPRPVPVLAIAFSPDGKQIAAGGYHEVTLWDAESGELLGRIGNLPQQIQSLAWSLDGQRFFAAGGTPGIGGEVKVLDASQKTELRSLIKTADTIFAVALSPDGTTLATGGADGAIRIFDTESGQRKHLIEQHADWILGLAWSDDGKLLASASRDKTARVFNAETGAMLHGYPGHTEAVFAVAFAADEKRIFSAGRDRRVHFWKTMESEKSDAQLAGAADDIFRVVRQGDWLFACGADRKIRQYHAEKRELTQTFEGHADWVFGLSLHLPGNRLATSSFDGEILVWDLSDGALLHRFTAAPR